jgi:hypothetical protein
LRREAATLIIKFRSAARRARAAPWRCEFLVRIQHGRRFPQMRAVGDRPRAARAMLMHRARAAAVHVRGGSAWRRPRRLLRDGRVISE